MHRLPADHQRDLDRLPSYYWWHRRRIETVVGAIERFLKPKPSDHLHYLDIGSGTGATTQAIADLLRQRLKVSVPAEDIVGIDGDPGLASLQGSKPMTFKNQDIEREWNVNKEGFELVTLLDVLEHVEEPVELLKRSRSQLKTQGIGVITVPAYGFLFSGWDKILGHKKRYTRRLLRRECQAAGFDVLWDSYLFSYMLPAAIAKRIFFTAHEGSAEFPMVPHFLNGVLRGVGIVERGLERLVPIPFGTSVTAVVRRAREQ